MSCLLCSRHVELALLLRKRRALPDSFRLPRRQDAVRGAWVITLYFRLSVLETALIAFLKELLALRKKSQKVKRVKLYLRTQSVVLLMAPNRCSAKFSLL